MEILNKDTDGPKSEKMGTNYWLLPRIALSGLASVFAEGVPKYGMHNYLKPFPPPAQITDDPFDIERWEHLINHSLDWRDAKPCDGRDPVHHLYKVAVNAIILAERHNARQAALAAKLARPVDNANQCSTDTKPPCSPSKSPRPAGPGHFAIPYEISNSAQKLSCLVWGEIGTPMAFGDGSTYSDKSYVQAERLARLAASRYNADAILGEWRVLTKELADYVLKDFRQAAAPWMQLRPKPRSPKNEKANRAIREGLDRTLPAYTPGRFLYVWRTAGYGKPQFLTGASSDNQFIWKFYGPYPCTVYKLGATPAEDKVVRQPQKRAKQTHVFAKDAQGTGHWVPKYGKEARLYAAQLMAEVSPNSSISQYEWQQLRAASPETVIDIIKKYFGAAHNPAARFASLLRTYRKCPASPALQMEARRRKA